MAMDGHTLTVKRRSNLEVGSGTEAPTGVADRLSESDASVQSNIHSAEVLVVPRQLPAHQLSG